MCQALNTQCVFNPRDASCFVNFSEETISRTVGNSLHERNVANRGLMEDSHP